MPRQHVENTKEFRSENEAKRANKHANRRIIYLPPFWNKVYGHCPADLVLRMRMSMATPSLYAYSEDGFHKG